jgi:anti-sigma regulatory factor (Ser/Thr protein kinase)
MIGPADRRDTGVDELIDHFTQTWIHKPNHDGRQPSAVTQERVLQLPGVAHAVATARHFAVDAGAELGAGAGLLPHIALVVSELATNAIQASPGRPFDVVISASGVSLTVEVRNRAARADFPDRSRWQPRDPLAVRGRGLGIVDELTDHVEIITDDDLVRVRVTVLLDPDAGRGSSPAGRSMP